MDDERLNTTAERLRNDEWSGHLPAPEDVRRTSDRRRRRRTTAIAFGCAVALPAALASVVSLSSPELSSEESRPPAGPASGSPSASVTGSPGRTTTSASVSIAPSTDATESAVAPPPETAEPTVAPTTAVTDSIVEATDPPRGAQRQLFASPGDRALAKLLLNTDEMPPGYIGLPDCCFHGDGTEGRPVAGESTCQARHGAAPNREYGQDGRIAQATRPIRYTGAEKTPGAVQLMPLLNRYRSPDAASAALRNYRDTLRSCPSVVFRTGQDYEGHLSVTFVGERPIGDETLRVITISEERKPTAGHWTAQTYVTRVGAVLQVFWVSRDVRASDGPVEDYAGADMELLDDFARRGARKISESE